MRGLDLPESDNPFDHGETDTEDGPDLHPLLTPVKVTATPVPTADEILQARQKSILHMPLIKPPPFAPKPLSSAPTSPPFGSYTGSDWYGITECCQTVERIAR